MALAWTTVALLVLLLPGFCFLLGLYAPEHYSRDVGPQSPVTHLAGFVLVSLFVHAILLGCISLGAAWNILAPIDFVMALAALQLDGADSVPLSHLAQNVADHWGKYVAYFSISSGVGFLFGFASGSAVLRFPRLRALAKHGWFLDLFATSGDQITLAYVLSKIHHEHRYLVYRGFLKEIFLTKDGAIGYVVLRNPVRYYLALEDEVAVTQDPETWSVIGRTSAKHAPTSSVAFSYLVLSGDEISNIIFDRHLIKASET